MAPPGARACNQTVTTLRPALSRLDTKPTTRSGAGTHLASDRLLPRAPCRPFQRADGGGAAVLRAKEVSGD